MKMNINRLKRYGKNTFVKYPVSVVYIYGSFARKATHPFSDIDFAVLANKKLQPSARLKIELSIENDLRDSLDITSPDVRIINDAPLSVNGEVVQNGILIYCNDESERVRFESKTLSEYLDFKPVEQKISEIIIENIKKRGL